MKTWTCSAGTFTGYESESCIHLRGIRYADAARFCAPVPYQYPEGIQECCSPAPICIQRPSALEQYLMGLNYEAFEQVENCQYLSLTIPKTEAENLPVLVWFHGGGFRNGGCDSDVYDFELIAAEQQMIVVGVNYRLGILGFGITEDGNPANHGLLDAIEGLRWIQNNIRAFQGDPDNVTIAGQSAGGEMVRCITLAEGTEALYKRAIIQSAPIGIMKNRSEMEEKVLKELRQMPKNADAETIRQTEASIRARLHEKSLARFLVFAPHYGAWPLPALDKIEARMAEIAASHALLIGSTTREVAVYGGEIRALELLDTFRMTEGAVEALMKKLSGAIFIQPAEDYARSYAMAGGRTYLYSFYWRENGSYIGAAHTMDLLPLFGGRAAAGRASAMGLSAEQIQEKGKPMRRIWASFAATGDPESLHVPGMLRIHLL